MTGNYLFVYSVIVKYLASVVHWRGIFGVITSLKRKGNNKHHLHYKLNCPYSLYSRSSMICMRIVKPVTMRERSGYRQHRHLLAFPILNAMMSPRFDRTLTFHDGVLPFPNLARTLYRKICPHPYKYACGNTCASGHLNVFAFSGCFPSSCLTT